MAKEKVYLETSVISYLTAWPSRDVVTLAKQELTREWWNGSKRYFDVYVSDPVMDEIQGGDPDAARLRMAAVAGLPKLAADDEARTLGGRLISTGLVPKKAALDALHIAIAAVNGVGYLMTWNCTHINNAVNRQGIAALIAESGHAGVVIATPEDLRRRDHE